MKNFSFLALVFVLSSCSSKLDYYKDNKPKISMRKFFCGANSGYGTVFDYKGRSVLRYSIKLNGICSGDRVILDTEIEYSDKTTTNDNRDVTFIDHDTFSGIGSNIIGFIKGDESGNAIFSKYDTKLGKEGLFTKVRAHEWVYLIDKNNAIMKIKFKKFGITVGKAVIFITKEKQ